MRLSHLLQGSGDRSDAYDRRGPHIVIETHVTAHQFGVRRKPPRPPVERFIKRGWLRAEQGQKEAGLDQLRQGLTAGQATGAKIASPNILIVMAKVYGATHRIEEDLKAVQEVFLMIDDCDRHVLGSEAKRIQGELLTLG